MISDPGFIDLDDLAHLLRKPPVRTAV
jgi:hypothetical protein